MEVKNACARHRLSERLGAMNRVADRIFLHPLFFALLFALACLFAWMRWEVGGAFAFVTLICLSLVLCDDIFATTLPFLLICVFVTRCYDSYDVFIEYIWMALPFVLCLLFHFIVYRQGVRIGSSFFGLLAVTLALTLGGVGFISASDYFQPTALYYTVFLGVGMVVFYLLVKSQLSAPRTYDAREMMLKLLYIMGLFVCLLILLVTYENIDKIIKSHKVTPFQASNNLCTLLMFALPCPFYFAGKNRLHIPVSLLMAACLFLTGSRGGILMGSLEFLICLVIFLLHDRKSRWIYIGILICAAVAVCLYGEELLRFATRLKPDKLISENEARYKLLERAKTLFGQSPVFGHGLGYTGNIDLYRPRTGAMCWYHMMIPQIVAGLGLVGCAGYGYQLFCRVRASLTAIRRGEGRTRGMALALSLSYIGVLLMSQVNPGLFCPIPYALLAVMIFALLDGEKAINIKRKGGKVS